jgi:hypothetical protein
MKNISVTINAGHDATRVVFEREAKGVSPILTRVWPFKGRK